MIKRERYMQQIRPFIGTDLVKVFTGIRRCGKSIMFRLIQEELQERGVAKERIVCVDLESAENYPLRDGKRFYEHIISLIGPPPPQQATTEKTYLFLDEIQELDKWETYINGLRPRHDVDIYVTGSNAKLLSGELATYLAGRYVQFEIHPFSFAEFSEMHRLLRGEKPVKEVFDDYIVFGGMPFLANLDLQYAPSMQYLRDVYKSVVVKDILLRNKIRDMDLLERIISYVLANVGKTFSATSIAKYLKNERRPVTPETILNYIKACEDAFLFHRVRRNDLQGKKLLTVNEKYYIVDHGFREAARENNTKSISIVLENMVYMELIKRGYSVTVGKIGDLEIDFVAEKQNEPVYVQVAYILADDSVIAREFGAFDKLDSHYPKYVLSMDEFDRSREGIKHLNIRDFLLGKELV